MRESLVRALGILLAFPVLADDALPVGLSGQVQGWAGGGAGGQLDRAIARITLASALPLADGLKLGGQAVLLAMEGIDRRHSFDDESGVLSRGFVSLTSDDYGQIQAGDQANAGFLIHNAAPSVSMIGGQNHLWWAWVADPVTHRGSLRTVDGDDGTARKLVYLSPSFGGLILAASYTPDINQRRAVTRLAGSDAVVVDGGGTPRLTGDLAVIGLSYGWSSGVMSGRSDLSLAEESGRRLTVLQGGSRLGYAGFTLAGSLMRRQSASPDPLTEEAAAAGIAWDCGLSYAIGPYSAAVTLFAESAAKGNRSDQARLAGLLPSAFGPLASTGLAADRDHAATLELGYRASPAVGLTLTLLDVGYRDGFGMAEGGKSGQAMIVGMVGSF